MKKCVQVVLLFLIIEILYLPVDAIISINFDDGYRSHLKAARIMNHYGFKATEFIVASPKRTCGAEGCMNNSEITQLYNNGWNIESHGLYHKKPENMTQDEFIHQYNVSRDLLNSNWPTVTSYASPFGHLTNDSMVQIRKYYKSHRGDGNVILYNRLDSFDPYNIKAFDIPPTMSMDDFKRAVEPAKNPNIWTVLVYHHVYNRPNSTWSISTANFTEQMEYLHRENFTVLTNRQVLDIWEINTEVSILHKYWHRIFHQLVQIFTSFFVNCGSL